jgi:putative tryptophan/tyrosine transport system substrate-binding protein
MTRRVRTAVRSRRSDNQEVAQIIAFVVTFAFGAAVTEAQQPKKLFRVGYLSNASPSAESADSEAISRRLRELGYVEGQNTSIDYRYGEGRRDRGPKLAAELVALNCDVIVVAGGYSWTRAVMDATKTIPIVMAGGGFDPVEAGLIKSLARPGGNVTGITSLSANLSNKRLELFKEGLPKMARIAVLYDSGNPGDQRLMKEDFPAVARALKFTLHPWEVKTADDFEKAFATVGKQRPDGLDVLGGGGLMVANRERIVNFALKSRLPSMYNAREYVYAGGLMSYGNDTEDNYRQIVWYVDKILKGTKPADLPVQQPMKFEFVVNLQTAKQIGVTINTDVLARATKIIR